MKRKKRKTIKYITVPLVQELKAIRGRLENDVKLYVDMVYEHNTSTNAEEGIGFWASVRLIMPIVEHTARVFYRDGQDREKTMRLLRRLNFKCPNIVWDMYRHSLMHTDKITVLILGQTLVYWGLGNTGTSQKVYIVKASEPIDPSVQAKVKYRVLIHLDTKTLYTDLIIFLNEEINKNPKRKVRLEKVIRYKKSDKRNQGLVSEIRHLKDSICV